jgi:hypothetical protein
VLCPFVDWLPSPRAHVYRTWWELSTIGTRIRRNLGLHASTSRHATEHCTSDDQPAGRKKDELESSDIEQGRGEHARAEPECDSSDAKHGNRRSEG